MSRPIDRFRAWARTPEPVEGAVLFRVALALWTLAYLVPRVPHLAEIYARPVLRVPLAPWRWLGDPAVGLLPVQALVALALSACLMLVIGHAVRRSHLVVLVALGLLFSLDTLLVRAYGGIALLSWALLWLVPHDRLPTPDHPVEEPGWGIRLLRLQFASIYTLSGLAKLAQSTQWLDGRAVHRIAASPEWGQWLLTRHGIGLELATVLGWTTVALELALGPLLLWQRTRWLGVAGVLGLHLGLALTVRVSVLFGLLMVAHLLLFLPAPLLRSAVDRFRTLRPR